MKQKEQCDALKKNFISNKGKEVRMQ